METREEISHAYNLGWNDGYDDEMYCNPYDEESEREMWLMYDIGFGDGLRES